MTNLTIEQEKDQAKLCVAWLATVNMHRAEENRFDRERNGGRWNEDDEWEDAVEDAKEEALEEGAYLLNPSQETLDYVKALKPSDLWILYEAVTTQKDGLTFVRLDDLYNAKRDEEYEAYLDAKDMNAEVEQDEPKED